MREPEAAQPLTQPPMVGAGSESSVVATPVNRLKPNRLGLLDVVFMAVATSAPITAMSGNVPFAVGYGVGTAAPSMYIFATVILTIFSVGYVAMARYVTSTGAFYGFISHGLSRVVGLGAGYMVAFAYSVFECSLIGIFSYFGHNLFHDQLGLNIPWPYFAFTVIVINAVMAHLDITFAAKVLTLFLFTEIAILMAMAVAVLVHGGGPDGLAVGSINPANALKPNGLAAASPGLALFIAFWSWTGFESTVMYGEESRNPKKIVPIATLIAVTGVGIFYLFVSWMTVAGNGYHASITRAVSNNPLDMFFHPTQVFLGHWAVLVFQWLMMTGSFACGLAFHNCAARYMYALGREGLLPRPLGRTHSRHGSPHVASVVQMVVAALWISGFWAFKKDPYLDIFVLLAMVGTFALLIVQTVTMAAVINYFRKHHREDRRFWQTRIAPAIGGVGMLGVLILMVQNLDTAAGSAANSLLFKLIPYLAGGLFLTGVTVAVCLRRSNPAKYLLIGRVVLADDTSGPACDTGARKSSTSA